MAKDPIKKADNGTYYFRANLGYNPITGKQIQKYRSGFRTKKEAKEEYSKLVLASTEELTTKKDGVSFQQFIEETYLPWYKTQVKESTYLNRATTIKKAIEEGVSAQEISERYIAECKKDMDGMNVKPATTNPQATQEINGMISMIQTLVDKGYAYPAADGTVYFRVKKFKEYGKLSHKNLDDLQSGFRSLQVSGEDQKEDPLDFVLWKPKKEGEPSWPSPWCDGRPGWHIECSVMAKKYLGDEIDIHAGGEDLIFPHHENEIAQSECCNDKIFAKYWMHNAFLNIDNRKMSKSLGNFRTVREISEQYDLQVLRFFMLNAHYRSPLNFSADLMEAAKNALERITDAAANLKDRKAAAQTETATEIGRAHV